MPASDSGATPAAVGRRTPATHPTNAAAVPADLLDAESEQVALAAVKEIYDRLLGRAAQSLELSGSGGGPITIQVVSALQPQSERS